MPIRNIEDIYVPPTRIRKTHDPARHEELVQSILKVGLLHPPVVEENGALLCGERRLRALQDIGERGLTYHSNKKFIQPGLIMTTDIRELTPLGRLEAEFDENTVRLDISWQEKAEATAALAALRQAQYTEAVEDGGVAVFRGHEPAALASELKTKPLEEVTRHDVRDVKADLYVQAWLGAHPEDTDVANAKSRAEALKVIETKMEDERRVALARRFLRRRGDHGHVIQVGDISHILPETPEGLYDAIVTDPPWGSGADKWTNGQAIRTHSYTDDLDTFERIHTSLATEGYRITKPRAHFYLFCSHQKFEWLAKLFRSFGWDVWPRPLIWYRGPQAGLAPRPEHGPKNTYECILFANKGDKRVLSLKPDVIIVPKPAEDPRAAAKPAGVYYDLLSRSVLPGDEVLDPCCGSGPIIPAANALKVRATCYDISEEAIGLTSQRLQESFTPDRVVVSTHRGRETHNVGASTKGIVIQ